MVVHHPLALSGNNLDAYKKEREIMPFSAILMMIITAVILYGGIAICVRIALKKKKPTDSSNRFSR
jgi:hypothetical protein